MFTDEAYTAIVLVPIVTSLVAAGLLRLVVRDWRGTAEEQERLDREEALERNIVVRTSRVLLPSRGGPASIAAAQVVHFAWPPEAAVTVLSVGGSGTVLEPIVNVLDDREVDIHRSPRSQEEALDRILEECRLGYGVVGLGVADVQGGGPLLTPLVDGLVNHSPVPVVIVRAARNLETRLPPAFRRAFVPVSGGRASRASQEIAFNIGKQLGTDIVLSHVVQEREPEGQRLVPSVFRRDGDAGGRDEDAVAEGLLQQAVTLARELGLDTQGHIVRGRSSPGEEIVAAAEEAEADLVVIGARARRLEGRPYLGANVEHILGDSDATVVVVVVPEDATGPG
ncbi:MAG: universal stress protein [Acidimicrobiia bacterium]|nr:universal stress protein [Acidimicrobiia bacterium]